MKTLLHHQPGHGLCQLACADESGRIDSAGHGDIEDGDSAGGSTCCDRHVFPIMYHAAEQVGYEPAPFLLALMIAANASYATPIAASPNMLVYGPGGYRFTDYMRIGIPLTLIVTITGVAAVVLTYPLGKL